MRHARGRPAIPETPAVDERHEPRSTRGHIGQPAAAYPARDGERLFHDLVSSREIRSGRRLARASVEESLRSYSDAIARRDEVADGFPAEAFAAMADAGLFRLPFAAPHGGGLEHPATVTAVTPCRRSRGARATSVTNSPVSDFLVTLCRTGDHQVVADPRPAQGHARRGVGRPDRKMGNRGQLTADVH
jgi:alkylation response protein AidB-like acyl-CoA dehydrogenase